MTQHYDPSDQEYYEDISKVGEGAAIGSDENDENDEDSDEDLGNDLGEDLGEDVFQSIDEREVVIAPVARSKKIRN